MKNYRDGSNPHISRILQGMLIIIFEILLIFITKKTHGHDLLFSSQFYKYGLKFGLSPCTLKRWVPCQLPYSSNTDSSHLIIPEAWSMAVFPNRVSAYPLGVRKNSQGGTGASS